ncbi:MAG: hypothetical protein HOO92_07520 [Methylococcaceae bacterium]|nr:hypothetical protein [Methylococcaceae bacterium]
MKLLKIINKELVVIVRSIDVGYGNTKFCKVGMNGEIECDHFPSIAKLHTGIDRGAGVMTRRDLIEVKSGESKYLVGKDSIDTLSARDDRGGHLLENYVDTPQYKALLRGALWYMKEESIDLLVSGLPVNHFGNDGNRMRDRLIGVHKYPDGREVVVKDAWIIPQPVGGFIDYFMTGSKITRVNDIKSLTLDVGYYTLDWVTCRGIRMQDERSGSVPGGMSLILEKLTQLISVDRNSQFSDVGIVDNGIRNGFKTRI